jgi:hypothetical protein
VAVAGTAVTVAPPVTVGGRAPAVAVADCAGDCRAGCDSGWDRRGGGRCCCHGDGLVGVQDRREGRAVAVATVAVTVGFCVAVTRRGDRSRRSGGGDRVDGRVRARGGDLTELELPELDLTENGGESHYASTVLDVATLSGCSRRVSVEGRCEVREGLQSDVHVGSLHGCLDERGERPQARQSERRPAQGVRDDASGALKRPFASASPTRSDRTVVGELVDRAASSGVHSVLPSQSADVDDLAVADDRVAAHHEITRQTPAPPAPPAPELRPLRLAPPPPPPPP